MSNIASVKQKILSRLHARMETKPVPFWVKWLLPKASHSLWTKPIAPQSSVTLSIFLASVLNKEDFAFMDQIEETMGVEGANDWLGDVLRESGYYHKHGDGDVSAFV